MNDISSFQERKKNIFATITITIGQQCMIYHYHCHLSYYRLYTILNCSQSGGIKSYTYVRKIKPKCGFDYLVFSAQLTRKTNRPPLEVMLMLIFARIKCVKRVWSLTAHGFGKTADNLVERFLYLNIQESLISLSQPQRFDESISISVSGFE